jgi:hypothetical protein
MKVDVRDLLWTVVALVLLGFSGWEWRRSSLIAEEIRVRSTAEAPLELVNAKLGTAAAYLWFRYKKECKIDWPSLQPLGINNRTLVTRTIQTDSAKEAFQQLFGEQVEIIETEAGLRAQAKKNE